MDLNINRLEAIAYYVTFLILLELTNYSGLMLCMAGKHMRAVSWIPGLCTGSLVLAIEKQ